MNNDWLITNKQSGEAVKKGLPLGGDPVAQSPVFLLEQHPQGVVLDMDLNPSFSCY